MSAQIFIVVTVVAVLSAFIYARIKARPRPIAAPRGADRKDVTVFNLELGDMVEHTGTTWVVEAVVVYDCEGYKWHEYLLSAGSDPSEDRWLSVEEDDRVEVTLVAVVPKDAVEGVVAGRAPPRELTYEGKTYRQTEAGEATVTRRLRSGGTEQRKVRFHDYATAGGGVLGVEDWGSDREVTAGQRVSPSSLTLYPGSGDAVLTNV